MAENSEAPIEKYDAIVCGTGLTECVLSGLLATHGYKVLHLDRNGFYGGECASLNLEQLYQKFGKGAPPAELGRSHQYNVDLVPKVLMCAGELVKILRSTVVERYNMEFMLIENSFVRKDKGTHKVPVTPKEALDSKLMGFFEKRNAAKFLEFVGNYDEQTEMTKKGGYNLRAMTAADLCKQFSLSTNTMDFIGHAAALHTNDDYLAGPAYPFVMRCKLYTDSLDMYGSSPYVYPLYGSGELPQAFSRLCAVYGGTYMLNTPVNRINYDQAGRFESLDFTVEGKPTRAAARFIVGDPSYFPERVKPIGKVVRCIAIMQQPIDTGMKPASKSCQIIIPQSELKRKNDMYILQLSADNKVCPDGFYIAIIGTVVENFQNPVADLEPGLKLLPKVLDTFVSVSDMFEPVDDGTATGTFVTNSYDAATHFESAAANILDLFQRIHGKPYNFETAPTAADGQ